MVVFRAPLGALAWLSIAAALAALPACGELARGAHASSELPVARREPFAPRHLLTGELVAERAIDVLAPDVGVRPLEIRFMVENGTPVEAGDLLMAFDNSELAAGLEQQRIAVLEARSALVTAESQSGSAAAQAQFELERRQADLDKARLEAAVPPELKSAEEYGRLQMELRKATSRLADAQKALEAARGIGSSEQRLKSLALERSGAELARLEEGIERLQVVAPTRGVALLGSNEREDRGWRVGDAVYPGERLATLPDLGTMIVRARLFDVDDGAIEPGAAAVVILDPFPDRVIGARIRHVDPMALQRDSRSTTRIFWVTVDLLELDVERLRPGMSAKVVVERGAPGGGRSDSGAGAGRPNRAAVDPLVVPRSSLDLANRAEPRVLLADGSWRTVELGPCDPLRCVVESGVEEGERLGWAGAPEARR